MSSAGRMEPSQPERSRGTGLPSLQRGGRTHQEKLRSKQVSIPASKQFFQKPSRPAEKSQPALKMDMTPWLKASASECSFTPFPSPVFPSPHHCAASPSGFPNAPLKRSVRIPKKEAEMLKSQDRLANGGVGSAAQSASQSSGDKRALVKREAGKRQGRPRGRSRWTKLPPVRSVTNLSFSRSFTFSFFELPEHQSQQQSLQRQRAIFLTMKELQH
nr:PREDICTED: uncharacterized protein LOC106706539 [Latimeria chalumnae]|eukprot:XP_014353124.1 PREDICTED: uncharacterized protein LOC106706539 [Latimeria chalumnae]